MNIIFKPITKLQPTSHKFLLDENPNDISFMSQEQKENYMKFVFQQIYDIIQNEVFSQNLADEVIKGIETLTKLADFGTYIPTNMFLYLFNLISNEMFKDYIFSFMSSTFAVNPNCAQDLFRNTRSINISYFVDSYRLPFTNVSNQKILKILVNSSKDISGELISLGILDRIKEAILFSLNSGKNYNDYWILILPILNDFIKSPTLSIVALEDIIDLCLMFVNNIFYQNAYYTLVEALKCIETTLVLTSQSKENDQFFRKITKKILQYLEILDLFLSEQADLNDIQLVLTIIKILATRDKGTELYKNGFIHHLINISQTWDPKLYQVPYATFISILTYILKWYHGAAFIETIMQANALYSSLTILEEGELASKDKISLFFSRLCNQTFWEYVIDFFENNRIILDLFSMLEVEISDESKIQIVYGLTSLLGNIITKHSIVPNLINQFFDPMSVEAFQSIKQNENPKIQEIVQILENHLNNIYFQNFK